MFAHPQKLPLLPGGLPSNTWLYGPTRAHKPNRLVQPFLQDSSPLRTHRQTTRQTDQATTCVAIGRFCAMHTMRPKICLMCGAPTFVGHCLFDQDLHC